MKGAQAWDKPVEADSTEVVNWDFGLWLLVLGLRHYTSYWIVCEGVSNVFTNHASDFLGTVTPLNAILENSYKGVSTIGQTIPRPSAILSVSAHWYLSGTHVTADGRTAHYSRLRRLSAGALSCSVSCSR
jgi:hypothetical protein